MKLNNLQSLIKACKKNDAKAQLQLYDSYAKAMYNIALRYVKQTDIAEDIIQEAFIKAFNKILMFNEKVTFGAWLKRIVINQSIDYLKKKKIAVISYDENPNTVDQVINNSIDWNTETNSSAEKIIQAIAELPYKYRVILQLFLLEGYDHQEISEILNISQVASRTQLSRGKNKLKLSLKKHHYAREH